MSQSWNISQTLLVWPNVLQRHYEIVYIAKLKL